MRDKKKMIVVGAVVLIIIIVLVVVFVFVRKGSEAIVELQSVEETKKLGMDNSGEFNEFEYQSDEDTGEEIETETVDTNELAELDKQQHQEFEKNKSNGLITGEGNNSSAIAVKRERGQSESKFEESENSETIENAIEGLNGGDIAEEVIEESDGEKDADVTIFKSSGYAEYEVVCDAESMEVAEEIASQIGGKVVECQNGVALIKITENVDDLLERLEQQGSSLQLYRNYYTSTP